MRVIDAHSGREVQVGDTIGIPAPDTKNAWFKVMEIERGILRARIRGISNVPTLDNTWLPLQVRWTHPSFFLQHVAFILT